MLRWLRDFLDWVVWDGGEDAWRQILEAPPQRDSNAHSSRFSLLSRTHELFHVEPLLQSAIVKLKGDFTFIDPFKIFTFSGVKDKFHRLQQSGHSNFSVNYKGEKAYILSSKSWTDDTFLEISRKGRFVFRSESPSSFISIIPTRLLHVLIPDEDVNLHADDGISVGSGDGICFRDVDGYLVPCENGLRVDSLEGLDLVCEAVDIDHRKKIWTIGSCSGSSSSS